MIGMRGCGRDMISLNIEISSKFYKTSHRTDINHTTAGRADPTEVTPLEAGCRLSDSS